jgi:phenylpropionate dioxygenase-like ring-hydroxylating dioxygenase large terminal subunit
MSVLPAGPASEIDIGQLVASDRVHGRLYYDPAVFHQELAKIWSRVWVYIGHESEIPRQGDFVRREIGLQPVIMVHSHDGAIRVLYNRCRHRANLVCHNERGNAAELTCPYHGWSYATTGALIAPTFGEAYDSALRQEDFGLIPVPRLDTYRGLVFASAAATGIGLEEHLGQAKALLDFAIDRSPCGEVMLTAGAQSVRYRGNWKMLAENSVENYHGAFVHKVAFALSDRRAGRVRPPPAKRLPDQADETIALAGGHMAEYLPRQGRPQLQKAPSAARKAYVAALIGAYGEERGRELAEAPPAFFFVFPNLLFIQTHFRRVQPVSAEETVVYYQPALLKGVPAEINREILRFHETSFGPAGFVTPDDIEIFERNQEALRARADEWLFLGRGAHREHPLADGGASGHFLDENHLRGMWHHYAQLMSAP